MKKYVIGVDGGTQSTKVFIFDFHGNMVCSAVQPLRPLILADPVVVLHPDDDLWTSLIAACRDCLSAFPGDLSEIAAVGLCTIRCCRALLREDGTLAYPVLSWMDRRLSVPYDRDEIPGVRYVTTTSGYITHRLTGQFRDTAANYEGQWPMDYDTWDWSRDEAVIAKYNVPRDMLLDVVMPGAVLGEITEEASGATGIPAGLPVMATANDKAVECLGAGPLGDRDILVSLGTYITSMMNGRENAHGTKTFWPNMACVPHRFTYESYGIRRGMWAVSWVKDLLGEGPVAAAKACGMSTEQYLDGQAASIPAGCAGLMTVPEFLAPVDAPYKRGVMIGFDGRHNGLYIYRSVLEAIVLTMYNNAMNMAAELKKTPERVIVSGGGSKGDLFMHIFADVFGLPAIRRSVASAVGLGSAVCACVGLGVYPDFDTAVKHMGVESESFLPDAANTALYGRMNREVYAHITDYTDEILKKSFAVFGR